jgi:septum formation protein
MGTEKRLTLVLASQSPRRKKILEFLSIPFRVVKSQGVDETALPGEKAPLLVKRLALAKARAVSKLYPHLPVLAADTVVVKKNRIYGKPKNFNEALKMLKSLQGTKHEVWTAAAFLWGEQRIEKSHSEKTTVFFKRLSQNQIVSYLKTKEPYDKAGAYDIQGTAAGWIGKWEGDYFNVMGLPIQWVVQQNEMISRLRKF